MFFYKYVLFETKSMVWKCRNDKNFGDFEVFLKEIT